MPWCTIQGCERHVAALRSEHEEAVRFFLMAVGRSPQRELVEIGLVDSLNELLGTVEAAQAKVAEDVALCDRLEQMLIVAGLPAVVRDELRAEVVAPGRPAEARPTGARPPQAARGIARRPEEP
jgi:hypothetical protein